MPIAIAIAEDNSFALKSCLQKIGEHPSFKVAVTATNGEELVKFLEKIAVDVVLMDIQMPVMDGITCTKAVKKLHPQVKVIMLTTFDDDEKIFEAIMAGASGYLLKEETAEVLQQAVTDAMGGGAAMSAGIALKVLNMVRKPIEERPVTPVTDYGLTKRELEILEQLKNGLGYEQIAANLFISYGTVRKHIEHIYRKLEVTNKVDAVQRANNNRFFYF